jgi:hypothetical protein
MTMHKPATHYALIANNDKTYQVPHRPQWHTGDPPGVGWWPANTEEDPEILRWWNGSEWSLPSNPRLNEHMASDLGRRTHKSPKPIKWSSQWWAGQ